jgi:hypothetical protein
MCEGMATLESEWDARNVPTLQTKLEVRPAAAGSALSVFRAPPSNAVPPHPLLLPFQIVRVSYFFLQSNGMRHDTPTSPSTTHHNTTAGLLPPSFTPLLLQSVRPFEFPCNLGNSGSICLVLSRHRRPMAT